MTEPIWYDRDGLPYVEDGDSGEAFLRVSECHELPLIAMFGLGVCAGCYATARHADGKPVMKRQITTPNTDRDYHRQLVREAGE